MSTIDVSGGRRLYGEIRAQGSKNAVLPILSAAILSGGEGIIHNCPNLSDVRASFDIIRALGGEVKYEDGSAVINTRNINRCRVPDGLCGGMRSSILFAGALLGRCGEAQLSRPGGCAIGLRPIDMHIAAFRKMGVEIEDTGGILYLKCDGIKGGTIDLPFPSVGATENIMLLAALGKGETYITNAACEPEVIELESFLNGMGAKVSGAGSKIIRIIGVEKLGKVEYNIMADRIFAATVLAAAAVCGGDVSLTEVQPECMRLMLSMLRDAGCHIDAYENSVRMRVDDRIKSFGRIITAPYPGFPTDAQALFMAAAVTADGTTAFVENVFENRYKHAAELSKMGADIIVDGRLAVVTGTNYIQGTKIKAEDLRGGASLIIAALGAIGESVISGIENIDRGYERIEETFSALGAKIDRK